jgi:hypothetical protein
MKTSIVAQQKWWLRRVFARMEKKRTPEAMRALAEAEVRRKLAQTTVLPKEVSGVSGPEPTRFGDWEKKGLTSDF